MKERFEKRLLTGNINVVCKYSEGKQRVWKARKEEVIEHIVRIVNEWSGQGYSLTLRQLHYQFVSHVPGYINHDSAYKKLGLILDDCRYSGVIDWDAIADRGRVPYLPYYADSVKEALEHLQSYYRRNRQDGQQYHIEVWTEKDALSDILRRVTEKFHVRLVVNKGYTSNSALYKAYRRFVQNAEHGQINVILYIGDHDPSGLDMVRDIEERLRFMFSNGDNAVNPEQFEIFPIGLNMKQIKRYKLPPNPTKLTDSRTSGYLKIHGKECWEVDALSPSVLSQLVEAGIESYLDSEQFEAMLKEESQDKATLTRLIKKQKR